LSTPFLTLLCVSPAFEKRKETQTRGVKPRKKEGRKRKAQLDAPQAAAQRARRRKRKKRGRHTEEFGDDLPPAPTPLP
jgi:hypothetical protein